MRMIASVHLENSENYSICNYNKTDPCTRLIASVHLKIFTSVHLQMCYRLVYLEVCIVYLVNNYNSIALRKYKKNQSLSFGFFLTNLCLVPFKILKLNESVTVFYAQNFTHLNKN